MAEPTSIQQRLRPEIVAYQTGNYRLVDDLTQLHGVRAVGATEATIFYCARMLEVLSGAAMQSIGLTPSSSAFSNLETLSQLNLIPLGTQYWSNALRRLGNDVRHILRQTAPADAELGTLFVERWLEWFFCQFRYGPRLPALTIDASTLEQSSQPALPLLMKAIDSEDFDPASWLPRNLGAAPPPYMAASTVAAVIANRLLDRGDGDDAFAVLQPASAAFPQDLRLQQLLVLCHKRRKELDKALEAVGPLLSRSKDDDETAGIVGGVYKQVYLDRGHDPDLLLKSFRAYLNGWESGKGSNTYLGINAAATALWLGRAAEARKLADQVKQLLLKRAAILAKQPDFDSLPFCLWDQVTLAEAELLGGDFAATRRLYHAAFTRWPKERGNIAVAKDQAGRHLAPLGLSVGSDQFFAAPDVPHSATPLLVGVTGHRKLTDESAIGQRINEALTSLREKGRPIILLSSLAAGADCLVAEAVLQPWVGGHLRAVLPLELAEYHRDFSPAELPRFQSLLDQAEKIVYPTPTAPQKTKGPAPVKPAEDRDLAYQRAGFLVADQCEVLLAIWDGQPARGPGGTAEVVERARAVGKTVVVIPV